MRRLFAERQPRRLLRRRLPAARPDHASDLALVTLTDPASPACDASQRADQRALRALAEENALLARELGRVQARCTQWRDGCVDQAERLEAQLMRARAEIIIQQTQLVVLRNALDAARPRPIVELDNADPPPRGAEPRARKGHPEAGRNAGGHGVTIPASVKHPCIPPPPLPGSLRVLCVGARVRQIPVYRVLVEREGGRLLHADGSDIGALPALRRLLAEADVVILQPAFVCQGACQAVELHCARQGLRCIQLDKSCALAFARGLAQALAGP